MHFKVCVYYLFILLIISTKEVYIILINKKYFSLFCCLFVITLIAAISASFYEQKSADVPALTADVTESEVISGSDVIAEDKTYFLNLHDGIICIYNCSDNSKILTDAITYIDIYSLDDDVRKSLETGVMFQNRLELTLFLENIGS